MTGTDDTMHFGGHAVRPAWESLKRGWAGKCPRCGKGHIFRAFLKVQDQCEVCGLELSHHRADDAPPYFTILIVGHIVIPLMLVYDRIAAPPLWHQMVLAVFGTGGACLWLLPHIKGALVAYQWAHRMHGFEDESGVSATDA